MVGDEVRFERAEFGGSYKKPMFLRFEFVTGKIVADSYGADKQQHTFTIELTNGTKTRIKGRNLYREGVWRKAWADESKRGLVADENTGAGTLLVLNAKCARWRVAMSIADRIEAAPACKVINLTEAEKDIYRGSGWKLARFENGVLAGFFDPMETPYNVDVQAMATEAVEAAQVWIANAVGEVWLVMCSCYQLCEPRKITLQDASGLAAMARVFAVQLSDSE